MKICIPVTGREGLQASLQAEFTEAEHILIYDLQSGEHRTFSRDGAEEPEDVNAPEEPIAVDVVLCSDMNPQIVRAFAMQGIQVLATDAQTVGGALLALQQGKVEELVVAGGCGGGCGCGGHDEDHECCGGQGDGCGCGGHDHGDDHECCGGGGGCGCHG